MVSIGELFSVCFLVILLLFFVALILMNSKNIVSNKWFIKKMWLVLIGVLVFAFFFKPNEIFRWDLIEHYKIIDQMRNMGFGRALLEGRYKNLFVTNFYYSLVSLLPSNQILSALPLLIDFCIFSYILMDCTCNEKMRASRYSFIFLAYISTMGLMLAISGIRCVWAVSVFALAYYLEGVKKEKKVIAYLLYIVAIFIHFFAVLIIAIRLLSSLRGKKLLKAISGLVLVLGVDIISKIARNVSSAYITEGLSTFLYEYKIYIMWDYFSGLTFAGKLTVINNIVLVLFLLYICNCVEKDKCFESSEKTKLNFAYTYAIVALTFCLNFLLLQRIMYVVAFCYVMILPMYFRKQNPQRNLINIGIGTLMTWVLFFVEIYSFIVNYVGYWFLTL